MAQPKASRNRTITLSPNERSSLEDKLIRLSGPTTIEEIRNGTINQDLLAILDWLPPAFADLLILDPPYNLTKKFGDQTFRRRSSAAYAEWLESWLPRLLTCLKPTGSVYICGDWRSSSAIQFVAEKYLRVRNRITWEREKGRGAASNWKNCAEDIWFCTVSDDYRFNTDAVRLRRRVKAPYRDALGRPKDWELSEAGNFRLTHASNLWTDVTVPFWSMPENTEHPAQKPEKLIAKLILASTNPSDTVFDPFLGSGTTSVVAAKLGRDYLGVEIDRSYCEIAEKRLAAVGRDSSIQGYADGVFWERNSLQSSPKTAASRLARQPLLFRERSR
jgi:site-specific DNA-methyltransferase (adenine-specific)